MTAPGQKSGQPSGTAPSAMDRAGVDWGRYLDMLVAERGSLAALAEQLAAQRAYADDLGTVERGLRRLRQRGHRDGGVWGRRVLALFGVPGGVERRLRWMGLYHSRFTDLATSLGEELVLPWDRPPWSESAARVWIHLARANVALRRRRHDRAAGHLQQASLVAPQPPEAAIELSLVKAFVIARAQPVRASELLEEAEQRLAGHALAPDDQACFFARLVDQRAYPLNKPPPGRAPDHRAALQLYASLPESGPPFARCRRHNGLGWSLLQLGERERAIAEGEASVREAGDAGSLRMRAMALNLLASAHPAGSDAALDAVRRARTIAAQLEDEELLGRYGHKRAAPAS